MASDKIEPKITLDNEDRASYQRARKTPVKPSNQVDISTVAAPAAKRGFPFGLIIVFLIALGGYGASYWLYQQSQIQLATIENSQQRISELESQLSATGEEIGESAVAMQVKVSALAEKTEELWQQMDKLWASAWRRNQTDIKSVTRQVTEHKKLTQKTFDQQAQQITLVNNKGNEVANNLNQLKQGVAQQAVQLHDLKETLLTNQTDSLQAETQLNAVKELLEKLEQQQKLLVQQVSTLSQKVKSTKPAVQPQPSTPNL